MCRIILFFFLLIFLLSYSFAQPDSSGLVNNNYKFDRVRILFGLNYTYFSPLIAQKDNYKGEYKVSEDVPTTFINYSNKSNVAQHYSASNIQFTLQANFWKSLYTGVHYHFFSIKDYKRPGGNLLSKSNSLFFIVAASFAYSFEFLKNKNLHIMPSFRIGGYTADNYYDAQGKKIYLGLDCKFRYLIKNKFGFSLGADYDFLRYKNKGYSDIFQKTTSQRTKLNNIYFNAGFCYNINIRLNKNE